MATIEVKHPSFFFTKSEADLILSRCNRTVDNVGIDINCIKEWIKSQPHLTKMPDDRLILNMLVNRKFSIECTKEVIDYYYSVRSIVPQIFANRFPTSEENKAVRKIWHTFFLPNLVNLNRVAFFVIDKGNHNYDIYTCLSKIFMDCEAFVLHNFSSGLELVIDLTLSDSRFWTLLTPMAAKIFITVVLKAYPSRSQAIRIIGMPKIAKLIVEAMISYLPVVAQERVSMHSNKMEMANFYSKDQLPVEYGGKGTTYREMSSQFNQMVDGCTNHFKEIQNYVVDPKLRPHKLKDDEMHGYYGTFRIVDVD